MSEATITIDQALAMAAQAHNSGDWSKAEAIYRQILQMQPDNSAALHNMGELAFRARKFEPAFDFLNRAVALEPTNANYINTLAVVLMSLGRQDESFEMCKRVVMLNPNHSNGHSNLAICLINRGMVNESLAHFNRAIELDPNNACAHDGLGLTLLMCGELQLGWREQEWRWRKHDFPPTRYPNAPHWRGEDLKGKTLILYIEQGYGDIFNFCRYVPLLAERGARVYLEEVSELGGLLRRSLPGLAGTFPPNQPPAYDYACPLMSAPMLYGTTLQTIPSNPASPQYLFPDPALVEQWAGFFRTDPNVKVGIAWAGRATHNNDLNRSTVLSTFGPLARVPGVTFYSLQKGPPAAQLSQPPPGMGLVDLSPRLDNFEVTAAILSHLDVVIAVDTVIIHLAAALGRRSWPVLAFCPDWRWLLGRSDSPWYPTIRLFRQPRRGDWAGAIDQVTVALSELQRSKKRTGG
jgi:Flp pilus assembly protein TadD